jgi:hypothetical protein
LIDRDQYQRNETFLIHLGEPSRMKGDDDLEEARTSTIDDERETILIEKLFSRNVRRTKINCRNG